MGLKRTLPRDPRKIADLGDLPPFRVRQKEDAVAMQTVIRASDSAEFLAVVPHLAGFRPRDSLAVVLFDGEALGAAIPFDRRRAHGRRGR